MNPDKEEVADASVPFNASLKPPFFPVNANSVIMGHDGNLYGVTQLTGYPNIFPSLGNFLMAPMIYNTPCFVPGMSGYYPTPYYSGNPYDITPSIPPEMQNHQINPPESVPFNGDIDAPGPSSSNQPDIPRIYSNNFIAPNFLNIYNPFFGSFHPNVNGMHQDFENSVTEDSVRKYYKVTLDSPSNQPDTSGTFSKRIPAPNFPNIPLQDFEKPINEDSRRKYSKVPRNRDTTAPGPSSSNQPDISKTIVVPNFPKTSKIYQNFKKHKIEDSKRKYSKVAPGPSSSKQPNSFSKAVTKVPFNKNIAVPGPSSSKQPDSSSKAVTKSAPAKNIELEKYKIEELNEKLANLMLTYTDYMTKKYSDQKFIVDGMKVLRINTEQKMKSKPTENSVKNGENNDKKGKKIINSQQKKKGKPTEHSVKNGAEINDIQQKMKDNPMEENVTNVENNDKNGAEINNVHQGMKGNPTEDSVKNCEEKNDKNGAQINNIQQKLKDKLTEENDKHGTEVNNIQQEMKGNPKENSVKNDKNVEEKNEKNGEEINNIEQKMKGNSTNDSVKNDKNGEEKNDKNGEEINNIQQKMKDNPTEDIVKNSEEINKNDEVWMVNLGSRGTKINKSVLEVIKIHQFNYPKATKKLLEVLFSRDVLASYSINKNSNSQLDENVMADIIEFVTSTYGVTEKLVRNTINSKCSEAAKMLRIFEKRNARRMGIL